MKGDVCVYSLPDAGSIFGHEICKSPKNSETSHQWFNFL